jgi:hypothetical protein
MGIDYKIQSKDYPDMYSENDPNQYLKYALQNIKWQEILEILGIRLDALLDSGIQYWCPEQVKDMYESIKRLHLEPTEDMNLQDDCKQLMEYFEHLVKHNAYIYVF